MTTTAFAELLARHRVAAGFRQRELARASGVSERAIRDLERGVRAPRSQSAQLIAEALQLADDELLVFLAAARPQLAATTRAPLSETLADLVGRDHELRAVYDLVVHGQHRLVTVTGQSGVGKSRLVAETAAALAARTDLTVRTLDLSAVHEPELVTELVAAALGCGPSRLPAVARVAAHLRDQRVVLIADRFEQLLPAAGELATMVQRCPGLRLVVTSQRPLRVRGERLVVLHPLAPAAASALLMRRATDAGVVLSSDEATCRAVATICERLGHLPLALELAAARLKLLSPAELAERLNWQLPVLADGARGVPERHRSLRAAIESSLELVSPEARTLFRWLGAFAGGAEVSDVEAVTAALGRDLGWLLSSLTELVDIHLVRVAAQAATRYILSDPMAELAAEQLSAGADRDLIARIVALRILDRVRHADRGQAPTVSDGDAANVRQAVTWATAHEPAALDAQAVTALCRWYETTGRLGEGQELLNRAAEAGVLPAWTGAGKLAAMRGSARIAENLARTGLNRAAAADHPHRAAALMLLAQTATDDGRQIDARRRLRAALSEARRAGDVALVGRVLNNLAAVSVERGRPRDADRQLRAALAAKRQAGAGPVELGRTLFNLAENGLELGVFARVEERSREAVALLVSGGFQRLAALAWTTSALAQLCEGRPAEAGATVQQALRLLAEDNEERRIAAIVRLRVSVVQHAVGELNAARDGLCSALPDAMRHGSRDRNEAADVVQIHGAYLAERDPLTAAVLLGAGEGIRQRHVPSWVGRLRDEAAEAAKRALGPERYAERWKHGHALNAEDLVTVCATLTAVQNRQLTAV